MKGHHRDCLMAVDGTSCRVGRESSRLVRSSKTYLVVAWVCFLLFLLSKAEEKVVLLGNSVTTPEPCPRPRGNDILPKTVVSSNLRMSVLVGLEGSGHHYLMQAVDDMFAFNDEISKDTTPCISQGHFSTQATVGRSPVAYAHACQRARGEIHDLALREQSLPWPGHLALMCRELSFPTGHGPSKALNYLDLPLLAAVAEEKGVDLRVVYLKRSAHDILVANTMHRDFHTRLGDDLTMHHPDKPYSKYALILMTNTAVIHAFLSEIDPAFIVCHDYAHAGEAEQAEVIANFVAPNPEIATMYNSSLLRTWMKRSYEPEELPFEGFEAVTALLQRELDAFESSYCG